MKKSLFAILTAAAVTVRPAQTPVAASKMQQGLRPLQAAPVAHALLEVDNGGIRF